jgi:hypothetical protein
MEVLAAGHYCCLLAINIFAGSPVKNFETQKRISQLGFSAQNSPNRYENRNSVKPPASFPSNTAVASPRKQKGQKRHADSADSADSADCEDALGCLLVRQG